MRDHRRTSGWPGRPDSGEIEIDGERWRWLTVGKVDCHPAPDPRARWISWSVRFRAVSRPDDSFWEDLPEEPHPSLDEAVRAAFRTGRDRKMD